MRLRYRLAKPTQMNMEGPKLSLLLVPPRPPFPLPEKGTVVLGRNHGCDLRLRDTDASRRHAKIICDASGYTIRDLSSTNGTFINGNRTDERVLASGDRIWIGNTDIVFYVLGTRPVSEQELVRQVRDPWLFPICAGLR